MKKIGGDDGRIRVGLVQINNSFSGQNYFPYSIGVLQAYALEHLREPDRFDFMPAIYKRMPVESILPMLRDADAVFFSTYLWNARISLEVARRLKEEKPGLLVVFGGPQVPNRVEPFLRANPFVDIACHGEGEVPFLSILEHCATGDWEEIPSIGYLDGRGMLVRNPGRPRISNLDEAPSPYLEGLFDPLVRANPGEVWLGLLETNRGCPFSCTFCDWGSATRSTVYPRDLDAIFGEIDWFSEHKVEFVFCCDANFGILKRDLEIVARFAENKKKYGYPEAFSVQNTKNSTDHSFRIQKALSDARMNKGVTLSLQSTHRDTLKAVKRQNISLKAFNDLQHSLTAEGIETYTDLILGLPRETYETFKDGVSSVIENGQHGRIQFNNLTLLPNTEMADPEYVRKYGIVTRETGIINIHGSLADVEEIRETQDLVVATNSMPEEDWIKTRVFSWMTAFLHFDKVLQVPLILLHKTCALGFRDMIEFFTDEAKSPILSEIRSAFEAKARDIQNGGAEYCESRKWLNIWWPADELALIELCAREGRLEEFYSEAERALAELLEKKSLVLPEGLMSEAVLLNRSLIRLPFVEEDIRLKLSYNIWDVYRAEIRGTSVPLEREDTVYRVDRSTLTWSSWEDWCREVIWYGNKKGLYLYSCERV